TGSPSASAPVAVAVSVSLVKGGSGLSTTVAVGALSTTVALALVGGPSTMPSFGVTSTVILSPLLPLPTRLRSSGSLLVFPATVMILTGTGLSFTFQTYLTVSGSPLRSEAVTLAVSMALVVGDEVLSTTPAVGGLFCTVTLNDMSTLAPKRSVARMVMFAE